MAFDRCFLTGNQFQEDGVTLDRDFIGCKVDHVPSNFQTQPENTNQFGHKYGILSSNTGGNAIRRHENILRNQNTVDMSSDSHSFEFWLILCDRSERLTAYFAFRLKKQYSDGI